jgi:hypothetical protein
LKNRRISLLASDDKNNDERPAVEDEVFFFQNDEIKTNAIKSVLAIHDFKRLSNPSNLLRNNYWRKKLLEAFPVLRKTCQLKHQTLLNTL